MVRLGMCRTWRSTLFPYTTLFRSAVEERQVALQELGQVLLAAADAGRGEFGIGQQLLSLGVFQQGHGQALLVPPFRLGTRRSEEHTSELQSRFDLVCRLLLEKKNS